MGQKGFCAKNVLGPKKFGVNLGWKKLGSFQIIAHRFLIKTNVDKILGAERFGQEKN